VTDGNPILQRYRWRIGYTGIWIGIILIQGVAVSLSNDIPLKLTLADALLFNLLFACVALPLWYPVRFSHWTTKNRYLSLLPHILLAGTLVTSWIIAGNQLISLFTSDPSYLSFLKASTGWRVMQGFLFYAVVVLFYYHYAHAAQRSKEIEELRQAIKKQEGIVSRITVKDRQQIHIIPIQELDFLEAYGDYVQLHTSKGVFLKEQTMKFFEEHLPAAQFVRIHRSYMVNINEVEKIELYEKERYRVYLKNGKSLKASDMGYKLLKEAIQ